MHMDQFRVYVWDIECFFEGRYGPGESEVICADGIYDLMDETVVMNLVGLDFYDLTLSQSLVEDCVADEVRYSGIVIFFHPLAYDFFFLGREADVVKVFAVLAVFCFHDSKFLIDDFRQCDCGADCVRTPMACAVVSQSLDNDPSCYLCQIKGLLFPSTKVRIVCVVVQM